MRRHLPVNKLIGFKDELTFKIFGMARQRRYFNCFAARRFRRERPDRIAFIVRFFEQKELFDLAESMNIFAFSEQSVSCQRDGFAGAIDGKFCDRRAKNYPNSDAERNRAHQKSQRERRERNSFMIGKAAERAVNENAADETEKRAEYPKTAGRFANNQLAR